MKILIVDDDVNTTEVIADSIDWQTLGIGEVYCAFGVSKAQKIMQQFEPEIVMCDIEMPGQSGIELLKWIRKEQFHTEFIFLTCHNSFDFATEAIEYGAIGYVLKPFTIDRTVPVIVKAVSKINRDRTIGEYEKYGRYIKNNKERVTRNFWNNLIHESDSVNSLIEQGVDLGVVNREGMYRIVLVCALKQNDDIEESILYLLKNIASELVTGDVETQNCIDYKLNNWNCVLIFMEEISDEELMSRSERVIMAAKQYLRRVVNCFISEETDLTGVAAVREKIECICMETPTIHGKVYNMSNERNETIKTEHAFPQEQYAEWLETGKQLSIVCDIRNQIETLDTDNAGARLEILYHDFIQVIYSVLARHEIQVHILLDDEIYNSLLKRANYSSLDFVKWASYVTEQTIRLIREQNTDKDIIGMAKRYIKKHYAEDLTRNEIADNIGLSPDYLSRQFKKETGIHINDYVNQYRIKKAKEYLYDPNINAGNVASMVGFGSATYFSTIFKKYVGITPNEYRKEVRGNGN